MQAILTKYLGPTNHRGSRIKAWCERGSITIPLAYELSLEDRHRAAVDELLWKFAREDAARFQGTTEHDHHWGQYVTGATPNGYAHVLVNWRENVALILRKQANTFAAGDNK